MQGFNPMGKIQASLAAVSTDFQLIDPDIYDFEITKCEDVEKDGVWVATIISSKVKSPGEMQDRVLQDYIYIRKPDEQIDPEKNIGLKNIKRYFEVAFGKEEVAGWSDEDFDFDRLLGKMWRGQIAIGSYTPKGGGAERKVNEIKRMESLEA